LARRTEENHAKPQSEEPIFSKSGTTLKKSTIGFLFPALLLEAIIHKETKIK
jgi:hypothetical protein